MHHQALEHQIEQLAIDIGRLRRHATPESSLAHLADRMASCVETIDCILQPTANDLYALYVNETGNETVAINQALADTDRRVHHVRSLTGADTR